LGKFFKASILVAGLLCLGLLQPAKADAIFTVTVTNAIGGPCVGLAICTQTMLGVGGSETATVDFASGGGFTLIDIGPDSLGPGGSTVNASLDASGLEALTSGGGATICTSGTPNFTVSGTTLTPGTGSECSSATTFSGSGFASQTGGGFLTYDGGNTWTLTDNSFAVTFTTTPTSTPEPSSLLMLGSGLLGLMGLGFRRNGIA
jgi:hypothetical protein